MKNKAFPAKITDKLLAKKNVHLKLIPISCELLNKTTRKRPEK